MSDTQANTNELEMAEDTKDGHLTTSDPDAPPGDALQDAVSHEGPLDAVTLDEAAAEAHDDASPDNVTVRRSVRTRTLTQKGLEHQLALKVKRREQVYRKILSHTDHVKSLMIEDIPVTEMQGLFSHWLSLYEQFLDINEDYCLLASQEEVQEDRDAWFNARNTELLSFKTRAEKWFEQLSKAGHERLQRSDRTRLNITDVASVRSHGSSRKSRSSRASSILSAKLKEVEKIAELTSQQNALKRKRELEQAKLSIKMEEEQLQLDAQLAAATARANVLERYEASSAASDAGPHEVTHAAEIHTAVKHELSSVSHLPQLSTSLNPEASTFVPKVQVEAEKTTPCRPVPDSSRLVETVSRQISTLREIPTTPPSAVRNNPSSVVQVNSPVCDQDSHSSSRATEDVILSVVRHLKKPASDLKKFGGDPLEFKKFIRQFQARVVNVCDDNDEKMNYLEQYTFGDANKIVSGYSYLNANVGYDAALSALRERYGDPNVLVNSYVQKALNWPCIKPDNAKGLDEFSIFITECMFAVQDTEAVKVLEYPDNLRRLVGKLPFYLHNKWRSIVQACRDEGRPVSLRKLVDLIAREAKKINDPLWGREAMNADITKMSPVKTRNVQSKGENTNEGEPQQKSIPKTSDSGESSTKRSAMSKPCWHCEGKHPMINCNVLANLPFADKSEAVRLKGLCFGCLRSGHQKRFCRDKATCTICGKCHPTIFHTSTPPQAAANSKDEQNTEVASGESDNKQCSSMASLQASDGCVSMGAGAGACTMAIIPVKVRVKNGTQCINTYAFLDPGSSVSFCSSRLMNELNADGKPMRVTVSTLGEPYTMNSHLLKNLEICDQSLQHVIELPPVYTKKDIPVARSHIPTNDDIAEWPHLNNVDLPQIDADIDLLIGNNVPDVFTPLEVLTGPRGSPHAARSILGWIVWNVIRNKSAQQLSVNRCEVSIFEEIQEGQHPRKAAPRQVTLDDDHDPLEREAILRNFSVDNLLESIDSDEEAIQLMQEVRSPCKKGDFGFTKLISTRRAMSESVAVEEMPVEGALGVGWSVETGEFGMIISLRSAQPTRRNPRSIVSPVFDPSVTLQEIQEIPKLKQLTVRLVPDDFGLAASTQIHGSSVASANDVALVHEANLVEQRFYVESRANDESRGLTQMQLQESDYLWSRSGDWKNDQPVVRAVSEIDEEGATVMNVLTVCWFLVAMRNLKKRAQQRKSMSKRFELEGRRDEAMPSLPNGRPVMKMSDDVNDYQVLAPNHLLLQQSRETLPCGLYNKVTVYARKSRRQIQYLAEGSGKEHDLPQGDVVLVVKVLKSR